MLTRVGIYEVGGCIVDLHEDRWGYCGVVYADPTIDPGDRVAWHFTELRGPPAGVHDERDLARAACSFGGYYSSDNRSHDVPDWAPSPEVADAISAASACEDKVTELNQLPPWCLDLEVEP